MQVKQQDVFIADDGKSFTSEKECLDHEAHLRKREGAFKGLRVYRVSHSFDETEGRGYFGKTMIVTDACIASVTQYCLDRWGAPLQQWYGDGFFGAWLIQHLSDTDTVEWAMAHNGYRPFIYHTPWELVVVSKNDFTWAGLPASTFPWPRPQKAPA